MTDVEERLRAALRAQAATIEPDPEASWTAVPAGWTGRWRRASLLAVPMFAALAVVTVLLVSAVVPSRQPQRMTGTVTQTPVAKNDRYYFVEERKVTDKNGEKKTETSARWMPVDPRRPTYYGVPGPRGTWTLSDFPSTPISADPAYDPENWPADPAAVLARAYRLADRSIAGGHTNSEPRDFQTLGVLEGMAGDPGSPPELVAAVFQAMTRIPGLRVRRDVTDLIGRPAVAVGGKNSLGGSDQVLFTPDTRAYRGHVAHLFDGPNNSWEIHSWRVVVRTGLVDRPGQIP